MGNTERLEEVKKFVEERNAAIYEAVVNGDLTHLRSMYMYGIQTPENDLVARAGACKACLQITTMPDDVKQKARKWLLDNGFKDQMRFDNWRMPIDSMPKDGQRVKIMTYEGAVYENVWFHEGWKNPWYKFKLGSMATAKVACWMPED
jgi:hypothetical protein